MTLTSSYATTKTSSLVAHAHIAVPSDTLPLVLELVQRLGGEVIADNEERTVVPPLPEHERVGKMLKGLRLRAEMTQKELAKAIGVPQGHISEYEAHKRPIPAAKVALLTQVLNSVAGHFVER